MLRKRETKLMPCLIQDFGIYCGNGIERSFPGAKTERKETKKTTEDCKNLVLEYIELEKEIEKLENKKSAIIKKINSNPELQKILAELTEENTSVKTK